jgi:diguanylate cyclase (GGDEF)-like protein
LRDLLARAKSIVRICCTGKACVPGACLQLAELERERAALQRERDELVRSREQLRHFAERDDLTGLWNRRIILERLRAEVDRSKRDRVPVSIILADLDHFKNVNDTLGHPAGDAVLREIGAVFLRSVRIYDWVGRYGGEEFLLILPGSGFESARLRAEQLRQAIQTMQIPYGETVIRTTSSFGVASGFPHEHGAMIQSVDAALYRAKDNGRNCVVATEIAPPESLEEMLEER